MVYFIIALAIATRFIPHLPNFAPITAIAIFSAAHLSWKKSLGITLATRLISDIFLGFFSWPLMIAVYVSHLLGIVMGLWIKHAKNHRWMKVAGSSLFASVLFFLVTNFAFLYANYPHNLNGIIQSYINGLPFLRGTLFGDLSYSLALFGGYEAVKALAHRKSKSLIPNP